MSFTLLGILQSQAAGGASYLDTPAYDMVSQVSASGKSITFSNLDTLGYEHYQFIWRGRSNNYNFGDDLLIYVNQSQGSNYILNRYWSQGGTPDQGPVQFTDGFLLSDAFVDDRFDSQYVSVGELTFQGVNSGAYGTFIGHFGQAGQVNQNQMFAGVTPYSQITSVTFEMRDGSFSGASMITMYGLKGA